ncbi:heterokaryon incompatibility protein-domain-containing protein [Bipolaris maydis]|nr:heterokaryon incompatibility protein-domain-containing protein [Bipolaris maydis]KAJ6194355.1 heterokaryon incompatibility protein-domain-containing protein [Bipolaris maydis]KAJ6281120.1 heterokaryon incompatibility protein-domain-containing protein [Bipolaris maydis]
MSARNQPAQSPAFESTKKRPLETECTLDYSVKRHRTTDSQITEEDFNYIPINSKEGYVRILTIQPGEFESPLEVDLDKCYQFPRFRSSQQLEEGLKPLQRSHSSPFDALSYTWGSPADPETLLIGSREKGKLHITQNLATALPYLRFPERERLIWIDAICINQSDYDERALQVQLMPDIYKAAEHVVCWVGKESDNSAIAFDAIRQLDRKLDVNLTEDTAKPRAEGDEHWADISTPLPFDDRVMQAISDLLGRSWFERLWVHQEVRLGSNRAVLQCGDLSIEWHKVVQANWSFRFKPWRHIVPLEFRRRMGIVNRTNFPIATNIGIIIRRTCRLKCSNPRDRVYAMRSTVRQEEQDMHIDVNYKLPVGKVYQSYVERFISHFQSLRLLPFCELQDHSLEMPTWVPDWSHPPNTNYPRAARYASGYMKANVLSISDERLEIAGMHIGTVAQRTVVNAGGTDEASIVQFIRDSAPPGILTSVHPGNVPMIEAFCCTLCFDVFRERAVPERAVFPSFTYSLKFLESILTADSDASKLNTPETTTYLRYVADACKGRSIIKTRSGHIGLAPSICEPEDRIYVFPGCRELIAVRKHGSDSEFRVVGHAYVHGMADGELIFGPLPRHYDVVLHSEEGALKGLQFRNSKDGTLEEQDPRLRDFCEEDFVEGLTGLGKAPRLEVLRARGVPLETVILV